MTTPDPIRAVFSPPELQRLIVEAADAAAAAAEPDVDRILRLAAIIRYVDGNHDKGAAALAAAILSHPGALEVFAQPRPVPVAERLPGAEDCDAEGRCWWWYSPVPEQTYGYWAHEDDATDRSYEEWPSAWLPAHALPLPTTEPQP